MTETVVHVETTEEWKSVLDVWFKRGHEWFVSGDSYQESYYSNRSNQLALNIHGAGEITCFIHTDYHGDSLIEYADFMAQLEKKMTKETYYVTQEQLDLIEELKGRPAPLDWIIMDYDTQYRALRVDITAENSNAVLRYLGGDTSIEFKLIEQLYRLWRIDTEHDKVYMKFTKTGNPDWTMDEDNAFTAPLEEIKKHKTISWEIEEVG